MQLDTADAALSEHGPDLPADAANTGTRVMPGRMVVPATHGRVGTALFGLLLVSLAVQILGIFHRNVNWDEFLFLSNVYQVTRGEAAGLLQTSYAHLFGWLTRIGGDEIAQIKLARAFYVVLWMGSLVLLYRLARHVLDPLAALAGVVLFALFSYSVVHAASFRIDGLVLPVLLGVALFLLSPTTRRVAAAGALSGLALALTIKASLWAPAFAGVLAVGLWHEPARIRPLLAGTLSAVLTFAAVMLSHSWMMTAGDGPAPGISSRALTSTGFRMLLEDGFLPRSDVLLQAFLQNPATWMLILAGLMLAIVELRQPHNRRKSVVLLLLALPIVSVAFYANAWPYAYIVLMPTACLLAGHALSRYLRGGNAVRKVSVAICLTLAAVPMAVSAWMLRGDQTAYQTQIFAIVHRLFDQPVAYIDKGGMISSFPRQPVFLSRWGLKNYRDAGVPVFARYIRAARPPLLIVNTPTLDVWDKNLIEQIDPRFRLLAEDAEALRATYAPFWGHIYVAGRQWRDLGPAETVTFDIAIAGDYTLISNGSAIIDGRTYGSGATVGLEAGPHTLQPGQPEPDLRLLWGRGTMIPEDEPPAMPIYTGL